MGPINVVVQDANNLVLEVTPTPTTTAIIDRGVAGPVGMVWNGIWSSATTYNVNDAVYYTTGNASYICILANTNQVPTNATYWQLLVSGAGNVTGAASSTDNAVARFDGTTGKLIQNSAVIIADDGSTVISTSSSTNALRITQTGAGNALLVEDSANPDSSPFVVDTAGRVVIGTTTPIATAASVTPFSLNVVGGTVSTSSMAAQRWSADAASSLLTFGKSRSATVGTYSIVSNNDNLGALYFEGDDGATFVRGASIGASVDGVLGQTAGTFAIGSSYRILTVGTTDFTLIGAASNTVGVTFTATGAGTGTGTAILTTGDMPARLTFSTSADNSGTPTERMRIDSTGQVFIGATSGAARTLAVGKAVTGATSAYGIFNYGQVQSDVTVAGYGIRNDLSTAVASFTLGSYFHFYAQQGTLGAGSAITNQYGVYIPSSLIGATNNYGFSGNIAAGTGRYNLYMGGTADNYLAGSLGIGSVPTAGTNFVNGKAVTGATTAYSTRSVATVQSDVTTAAIVYDSAPSTQAAAFTLPTLQHYRANQVTIGAGSAVTTQIGFSAESTLTGATNNYGFYGNIPFGSGRYNLYMAGAAPSYISSSLGIGTTTPQSKLEVNGDITLTAANSKIVGDSITLQSNTANAGTTVQVTPNGTGNFAQLSLQNGAVNYSSFTFGVQSSGTGVISGNFGGTGFYGPFQLDLNAGSGGMYWDTQGNVGMGTTSPVSLTNYRGLSMNATNGGFVEFLSASTSVGEIIADTNGLQLTSVTAKPIVIKTNNTERVRVDSVGSTYIETGNLWQYAPAPTSKAAAATLTAAELFTGILNTTGTTYTVTVPTGTNIDAFYTQVPATNIGFDLFVINTASGTITMAVNTGVTAVGALTVLTATSAQFRFRRTAANTYVMYRLG